MTTAKRLITDGKVFTEALFLTAFSFYVIFFYLQTTTFILDIPGEYYSIIRGVLLACGLYRIYVFKDELGIPVISVLSLFVGLGLFFAVSRADTFVLDAAIITAGAVNVSFKRIGIIYVYIGALISLLALVCSRTGIIPDYIFHTNYGVNESVRHSFGIIYPTDCFAHIFYLAVIYFILRWKRITYFEIAGAGVVFAGVFYFTRARIDMISAVLMLIAVLVCKLFKFRAIKIGNKIKAVTVSALMPVCAAAITVITYFYDETNSFMYSLDAKMSYRLSLGKIGMGLYGFKLLGNPNFAENGNANGGVRNYAYVFYDSAYIKYLFKYGIILLVVLFVIYALIGIRLIRKDMLYGMVFVGLITMTLMIEHHMLELSYNITLLLLTADISTILQCGSPIYINNKNGIMAKTN